MLGIGQEVHQQEIFSCQIVDVIAKLNHSVVVSRGKTGEFHQKVGMHLLQIVCHCFHDADDLIGTRKQASARGMQNVKRTKVTMRPSVVPRTDAAESQDRYVTFVEESTTQAFSGTVTMLKGMIALQKDKLLADVHDHGKSDTQESRVSKNT